MSTEQKLKKEIARLKAEVERLRIERNGFEQAMKANQSILKTKRVAIERLRKAGDELSWAFAFAVSRDDGKESGLIKAWNAAKDGKPTK